ncbi:uncharacterized protein LOC121112474 [Gallus gallus]|uniref:uncharacterized protein LOC121112474 n=1 Tax=Gallus gallus TaxID=9031 RepID=UPI001AE55C97|nr:uncharacterized protein LOC121112474 [Gallus gallus]
MSLEMVSKDPKEVLLYVGGHRIPDGNSLWRAKEKQVTLCTCRFPAALPLPAGSEVADGKCRLCARIGYSSTPVVAVEPCTFGVGAGGSGGTPRCGAILAEAHPVPPRASGLLLVGASHAGAHPFRCVCSLPDAPSGCRPHQRAPPSYPSRVAVSQTSPRRRGDSSGQCWPPPMMTLAPAACCPPRVAVLAPLCFLSLLFFALHAM